MPDELTLRHLTMDQALPVLQQYLNDAFMAGLPWVKIIHGKSGGTIKGLVWGELAHHPLVASYRLGEYGEGGHGVTIVCLSSR